MNRLELIAYSFGVPPDPSNAGPDLHFEFIIGHAQGAEAHVASHVGVSWRRVTTTRGVTLLAGIGYVCTDPDWQHRGLMRKLVECAHIEARHRGYQLAGLFTDRPALYEELGYQRVPANPPKVPRCFMVAELEGQGLDPATIVSTRGVW